MSECSVSSSSLSWSAAMGLQLHSKVPFNEFVALKDSNFGPSADDNAKATEESKSYRDDYDLNRAHTSDDSIKEALRNTLLNQDQIFRKQVVELHRIYWTQNNIMTDYGWKELDEFNFMKASTQPMLDLFVNHTNDQSSASEKASLTIPEVQTITLEKLSETKHYSHRKREYSCKDNLWLSLSIGGDRWQNGGGRRTFRKKDINLSTKIVIDLDGSTEPISRGVLKATSAIFSDNPLASSGVKQDSTESIQSSLCFANSMSKFWENGSTNCSENNSTSRVPSAVIELCHGELACKETKDDIGKYLDLEELDLNRDLVDNSSFHLDDPPRVNSGERRLAGKIQEDKFPHATYWKKQDGNCSAEMSTLLRQDTATSALMGSDGKGNVEIIDGSIMGPMDLGSSSEMPLECHSNPDSHIGNSKHIITPVPSDHIAENCSSTETIQSPTDLKKSNVSSQDKFENSGSSRVEKPSSYQESESFSVSKTKSETCSETKEEVAELDDMVRKGAVSLVYFALDSSSGDQDGFSKAEETNETGNMKKDMPLCSSESYESVVLKLPESSMDDYCVSSKPFEVYETSRKDSGVKLRRGRRLKDFKKEILPHLPSLSSCEISEDMKIMEGVLRSREYKRLRSKMNDGQNWSSPVRSRRSKPNYVGRR